MKKRRLQLLLVLLVVAGQLFAQNARIDSLNRALSNASNEQERANVLTDLCFAYRNIDPTKSIELATEGYELSMSIDYPFGAALCLRNIGLGYQKLGQLDKAEAYALQSLELAQTHDEIKVMGDVYNTLGVIAFDKNELSRSTSNFRLANRYFRRADSIGNRGNIAGNYMNLGLINAQLGFLDSAIINYTLAAKKFSLLSDRQSEAMAYSFLAPVKLAFGDTSKAIDDLNQAISMNKNLGVFTFQAEDLQSLANIYLDLGDTISALEEADKSLALLGKIATPCQNPGLRTDLASLYFRCGFIKKSRTLLNEQFNIFLSCDDEDERAEALIVRAEMQVFEGQISPALVSLKEALNIAERLARQPLLLKVLSALYHFHRSNADDAIALSYLERVRKLEMEISSRKKNQDLARLEAEFAFTKERERIVRKEQAALLKITEQQRIQTLMVVALVFLTLVVFITWHYYRLKRKANNALNKTNTRLEQLNDEKNTLIGTVAHDLKNPLGQIKGLTELLIHSSELSRNEQEKFFQYINDSSDRAVKMIENILDLSAIEHMKINKSLKPVLLYSIVQSSLESFSFHAREKDIQLNPPNNESLMAIADEDLFRQAFDNLLSNAIKFSNSGKSVRIVIKEENGLVAVQVIDEGPGISSADQERIFHKFTTLGHRPTGSESSTGLGMAIVKRFVEEMNGHIDLYSQEGVGTTFTIWLPKVA